MSDEELILKQYDQKFWELVDDKGYSYRKARRILKKKYPSVYYNDQKDKWFINDHVYRLEADNEAEIVGGDDQMDVLLRFFTSFLVNLIFIDVAFLVINFSLNHLSKFEKIVIFAVALINAFVFVAFG